MRSSASFASPSTLLMQHEKGLNQGTLCLLYSVTY